MFNKEIVSNRDNYLNYTQNYSYSYRGGLNRSGRLN